MASTTTNYGWVVPTSSDLVKNGATAISTLGQSIDTSMVDLRGGTAGQSLVKATSTEMDFAWSSTPSASNPVLNSAMQVWQRGTSIACSSTAYTVDRWQGYRAVAGGTVSRQATGDTTNLPNIQYAARVQRDNANTSTSGIYLYQTFETINSIPFAGKTITFSFYARAGANYSAASSALNTFIQTGTGTDQNAITGFTGNTNIIAQSPILTTTWQRFTYTASVGSTATQLGMSLGYAPVGTAGAADYFEVTGVQIDIGSVALPFRTAGTSYQQELALCQRYYYRISSDASSTYALFNSGGYFGTTTAYYGSVQNPVTMRTVPSSVDYANLSITSSAGLNYAVSAFGVDGNTDTTWGFSITATLTGATAGLFGRIIVNNNSAAYLGYSAEL